MEEINLLQNRTKTDTSHPWQRQSKLTVVILSIVLILIVGATAALFFLNRSENTKVATVTANNQNLQKTLDTQQADLLNAKIFQAQLSNIKLLLDNHVYVSPVLEELSKFTYTKAQYVTLDVTSEGKIHLEGRVANYSDLGKLLLGLSTSKEFSNIQLLSATPSTGKINAYIFSVDLTAAPDIFVKK